MRTGSYGIVWYPALAAVAAGDIVALVMACCLSGGYPSVQKKCSQFVRMAKLGGNATVTDPDHLPGPSKVILGNMIRV